MASPPLERRLCQVGGVNQNYTSRSGTLYHIQVEDLGPVLDRVTETEVRRLNVIVYANYGERDAHIVHGQDHDHPDVRSHEYNDQMKARVAELAAQARQIVEDKEQRHIERLKALIRDYYVTRSDAVKKELEEQNSVFPFLFSRAWRELKDQKATAGAEAPPLASSPGPEPEPEVVYPLDRELRAHVIEIERLVRDLREGVERLRAEGKADDILVQTCRKLVTRALEALSDPEAPGFTVKRLEMTRNSLMTTWRQVNSRLKA